MRDIHDKAKPVEKLGRKLFRDQGADMAFRTYVNSVPEPSTLLLLDLGLLGITGIKRKNFTITQ